jgi:UDP-N-acetylmuramoyl-tripeptide--D-alanyl-D-alanine ligase
METKEIYEVFKKSTGVCTDTRQISDGKMFFALKGGNFNGNTFASKSIEMGAMCCVIDEAEFFIDDEKTILVKDVLTTLQELATYHRDQFSIPVIGITGSNGKTTSKELMNAVISKKYKTHCTKGNLNNHIGVPLTLLEMPIDTEIAIIEMGANHTKEIEAYCQWAKPNIGVITNIGRAHLEGFGGIEGVIKAKTELYQWIHKVSGTLFVHSNDELLMMHKGLIDHRTYGNESSDFPCTYINAAGFAALEINDEKIVSRLVGEYNCPNLALAAAFGHYFSIDIADIKIALEQYEPTNSRSQLLVQDTNTLIMDAYNANPSSMKVAIDNLANMPQSNKVALLGAMKEMGIYSADEHLTLIEYAISKQINQIVAVGEEYKTFANTKEILYFENSHLARDWYQSQTFENAAILIKGSRGSAMEKLLETD